MLNWSVKLWESVKKLHQFNVGDLVLARDYRTKQAVYVVHGPHAFWENVVGS